MVDELLEMYHEGAITGYQLMLDCLHLLDPEHPDLVLSHLPDEILDEALRYAHRYDPSCMRSLSGMPPSLDQVVAAQRWIEEQRRRQAEHNVTSSS